MQGFGARHRTHVVACVLGMLIVVPVTTFALELGDASIKSGLGQSLLVEIPYRLAANERLTSACVGLVLASNSADAVPTYTSVTRISVNPTHIEIFDNASVREPLIGLNIDVHCDTAPHFVRSYELFVDPPARLPSNDTAVVGVRPQSAITASAPAATTQPLTRSAIPSSTATTSRAPTASTAPTTTARATTSPRARGHAGGSLTQGQTYRVVRGDTLSGIAARIADRPTIRQTSDAIFAANANAFTRGNRDLIEEGRSITIPIMTPAATTLTTAAPAPAPAAREPELPAVPTLPLTTVDLAPAPTSATLPVLAQDPAGVVAPVAVEPATVEPAIEPVPAAAAIPEPSAAPVPAATRPELAPEAPSEPATGRISLWLAALLTLGGIILLTAPLAFVLARRRKQQVAPPVRGRVQQSRPRRLVDPISGIDVVEGPMNRPSSNEEVAWTGSPAIEPAADSGAGLSADLKNVALSIDPADTIDLDVGVPLAMNERVDWFADRVEDVAPDAAAVGDETVEENAATIRMRDVDTALTVRQPAPDSKPDRTEETINDEQMTLTIVELDMLRQDYETEHTLTQQSSQALRDAVADLEATKAARTAETATLESPAQEETTDGAGDSTTARRRVK